MTFDPTATSLGIRRKLIPARPATQSAAAGLVAAERAAPSDPSAIALHQRREPAMNKTAAAPVFTIRNLSVLAYAQGFTLWHYRADAARLPETLCAGFFDAAADMFAVGDMLMISAVDGGIMVCVATTGHAVSVAPLSGTPAAAAVE